MYFRAIFCAAALLFAPCAQAALVDTGQYALDTDTNLEWLNLTLTQGVSYDSILSGQGGWLANGWQFATPAQFEQLATAYIGPGSNCSGSCPFGGGGFSEVYYLAAASVVSALGATYVGDGEASQGLLGGSYVGGRVGAGTQNAYIPDGEWSVSYSSFGDPDTGDFLVRSGDYVATPEASTWLMVLVGLGGLGYAARQRKISA